MCLYCNYSAIILSHMDTFSTWSVKNGKNASSLKEKKKTHNFCLEECTQANPEMERYISLNCKATEKRSYSLRRSMCFKFLQSFS